MLKKTIIAISMMGLLTGCQSTAKVDGGQYMEEMACFYPDAPQQKAPQWICGITPAHLEISATGYAKKSVAGMSIMSDISINDARTNLGRQFETNVKSIIKTVTAATTESTTGGVSENINEYFENVTKSISSTTLNNSRVITKRTSPAGGLYTLVGMDKATFDQNFAKVIKKAEAKDADMWSKFNDKKTSEELSKIMFQLNK